MLTLRWLWGTLRGCAHRLTLCPEELLVPTLRIHREGVLLVEHRLRPGRTTIGRADSCDLALPGETVSRVHCILDGRDGQWTIIDRSRHGTTIDGVPTTGARAVVADGSQIGVGPFLLELSLELGAAAPTAPREPEHSHELVLAHDGGSFAVERARLTITEGPNAGDVHILEATRISLGGPGSGLVLADPLLARHHCWLRVARGRVMLEPGAGPVQFDGHRLREITPIQSEEQFRIGDTMLQVGRDQQDELPYAQRFGDLVGESDAMRRLFGTLRRMAGHHYTMLVIGESGTGKELIARGVHDHSKRSERAFVALNCGAISPTLFESELFGHEKGAFTGADKRRAGAFQQADGGTLFLDEIGELPEDAQAKLLRALETGEVRRVGGNAVEFPDVRVVAATNRDLAREVQEGRFREDLFFRLAVLSVQVPPLRDRIDDVPILAATLCRALGGAELTAGAMELLQRHRWPGNVRELRNVLTRAYVMHGSRIDKDALSFHQLGPPPAPARPQKADGEAAEKAYLESILESNGGNRSAAARELGVARSTLHYKLKKHNLM